MDLYGHSSICLLGLVFSVKQGTYLLFFTVMAANDSYRLKLYMPDVLNIAFHIRQVGCGNTSHLHVNISNLGQGTD